MTWTEYAGELDRGLRQLGRAASEWMRLRLAARTVRPPRILQFPVNDICNSRCVMCDVWKRKKDREITPAELAGLLRHPFFSEVRFVGLSGGEPTLRRDLPQIGEALCVSLPKLTGVHIISNGLRSGSVVSVLLDLGKIVRQHGRAFHVNISIDGVGEIHDRHRGCAGNFASCVKVIDSLRSAGIQVGIGCTLTTINCDYADDVLMWAEERGIHPVYFRLGVDIRRLYNEGFRTGHPFTREQRFHLAVFFEKLASHPKMDRLRQQISASLAAQLWDGALRNAGCQWQDDGITLDSRGDLSFCSVASEILGSALKEDAGILVRRGLSERRRILKECCRHCQHDLIGPLPSGVLLQEAWKTISQPWRRDFETLRRWTRREPRVRAGRIQPRRPGPSTWRSVLITGWYGTETAGDKAILGALLSFLRRHARNCERVSLCTLNRRVSEQTLHELGAEGVALIPFAEGARHRCIAANDAVIVGGGPLYAIPQLNLVAEQFEEAAKQRRARVLFGCGVGPLDGRGDLRALVRIVQLASAGFYRDVESREAATRFGGNLDLTVGFDPSLAFLRQWREDHGVEGRPDERSHPRRLAVLMRANTGEYVHGATAAAVGSLNKDVAAKVAAALQSVAENGGLEARLLAMHSLPTGGDDRLFNRQIEAAGAHPCAVRTTRAYLSLHDLLTEIAACTITLPMRYHGHLFSLALGKPFVSVDYSGESGKVASLVRRLEWGEFGVPWCDLKASELAVRIERAFAQESELRARLLRAGDGFQETLQRAYAALAAA